MEISIIYHSNIPLYWQLLNHLHHFILSGQWPPGSRVSIEIKLNISHSPSVIES